MSITVRVIFWGLMGFVPNEEGQKGLTALLVSPHDQAAPAGSCAHAPAVYLFEGECVGDKCIRAPTGETRLATGLGGVIPELRWPLEGEDLEIFGEEKKVKFRSRSRKKWFGWFGDLVDFPRRERQATDFSWVPSLSALSGGYGRIQAECLTAGNNCGLSARFTVRGGRASACHLFHDPVTNPMHNPRDESRDIVIFDFKAPGSKIPFTTQAVADAVQVVFEVEGDHVELRSWGFAAAEAKQDPGKQDAYLHVKKSSQTLRASVRLRPAANSRTLTLIVANGPFPAHNADDGDPTCLSSPQHSDALFELLARDPGVRLQPIRNRTERGHPGSCEREIAALEGASEDGATFPHSSTLCDGRTFQ